MKEKNMKQMRLFAMGLVALMAAAAVSVPNAKATDLSYSADIGAFSKYVWRGVQQSTGSAVQGDIIANYGGFSGSVWMSNSYPSPAPQYGGNSVVETDWTLQYAGSVGDFGYSIGGLYYTYLYDSASNFPEVFVSGSYSAPITPSVKVSYTAADSAITTQGTKTYLAGDTWVDAGLSGALMGVNLSGTVSFASWKSDAVNRPKTPIDTWKSGAELVTLSMSKGFQVAGISATPSLTGTIPIIGKSSDGNRYIYGVVVHPEVILGVDFSI
jgi:uncharacterized protein (TIGR02001 family)